jgi:hypothetical protein
MALHKRRLGGGGRLGQQTSHEAAPNSLFATIIGVLISIITSLYSDFFFAVKVASLN